jgi:hypothetical protein
MKYLSPAPPRPEQDPPRTGDRPLGGSQSAAQTRTLEPAPSGRVSFSFHTPPLDARDGPEEAPQTLDSLRSRVEREEHAGNVIRMRKAAGTGAFLWPAFFATDWLMSTYVHQVSWLSYAGIRACAWVSVISGYLLLKLTRTPTRTTLLVSELLVYGAAAVAVSFMCLLYGGLASPYAAGIPVVFTVRAAFLAVPWRQALVSTILCSLAYPAVLLGAALARGELGSVLDRPSEFALFLLYNGFIWTALAATVSGGHAMWALRRQVFEARSLGRYRLVRQLARGGMGEVWVAHHTTLRRDVAVKILRTDQQSENALRRFEREVQATTELTHPNTVRVFDYGATDDGLWYYAMELLEGEDLARAVRFHGPMSSRRTVHLMLQACGALSEAHARGIVHRDIKPENIFLCASAGVQDFVKVIDFGIAKLDDGGRSTAITNVGRMLGTPAYLSPEVALGGKADARTDVYGLGGVLYYLLTGCAPFEEIAATELIAAHVTKVPMLPSLRPDAVVDPKLEHVIMRCLAKDPAQRFAHAGELWTALMETFAGDSPVPQATESVR